MERRNEKRHQILMRQRQQLDSLSQQRASPLQQDPLIVTTVPSQRKSSVGSTPVVDDALMARYPVDDITERTNCELHMAMKNISMKVAAGFALPSEPGVTTSYHGCPIPAGYARVGMDEFMKGYETLELDYPAGEGEMMLGEVTHGFVLWRKEHIVFADSAPRPPTPPPSSNRSLSPPPFIDRVTRVSPY